MSLEEFKEASLKAEEEKLRSYEDHFVHRLAKLLQLNHSDLIEAKLKAKYENG